MIISDIVPFVQAQVKMCPLPMIFAEVRWAAGKYLEDSRAWTKTVRDMPLKAGSILHKIPVPTDTRATNVYDVRLNILDDDGRRRGRGSLVCVQGDGDFDYDQRFDNRSVLPRFWRMEEEQLRVWPVPDEGTAKHVSLDVDVTLTIAGKNPVIPDWCDMNVIGYGALSKLYALVGQDWFNAETALWFEEKFKKGIAELRIERIHGGKPGSMNITAPQFGGYF